MAEIAESVRRASATLEAVIDRVCGACENSCCHQGTMMGSSDARRLYRGLRIEPGREELVRTGLRKRAEELIADLKALRNVAALVRLSVGEGRTAELAALDKCLDSWQAFCDNLIGEADLSPAGLIKLLQFSAIRSNCLRALREFEGAQSALVNLSRGSSSFRLSGRRVAAPRCLFHYNGCLAGRWKPAKCANFFCAGTPNVLKEVAREMSFDEFVLANLAVTSPDELTVAIGLELDLGREFVEPKIVVGLPDPAREALGEQIRAAFGGNVRAETGSMFMWSTAEARGKLQALETDEALVMSFKSAGGAALYELAVAIDALRATGTSPALYLFIDHLAMPSPLAHPLWADSMMSQPLGSLDLYVVE
jgi:hypothetical protein